MKDTKLRAECDRVLRAMYEHTAQYDSVEIGNWGVAGQRSTMLSALEKDASTFRKIHIIGEMNTFILIVEGADVINETDWYNTLPYSRELELAQQESEE